jgi:hypothetical protein
MHPTTNIVAKVMLIHKQRPKRSATWRMHWPHLDYGWVGQGSPQAAPHMPPQRKRIHEVVVGTRPVP